jgi:uncharacterized membrane protein
MRGDRANDWIRKPGILGLVVDISDRNDFLCFLMMRGRMCCTTGRHDGQNPAERHQSASSESARDILDKRYALSEISKEEYEEKKKDISD